jgi:5-enolpyruvylshikimate-3-phosphate synthase
VIENAECIDDSFPGFTGVMRGLGAEMGVGREA